MPTDTAIHLHLDDCPATLRLMAELAGRNGRLEAIGYEPTEHGAWIDWEQLLGSWLSSTEKAVVHIARGCQVLEHSGGPAPRLSPVLRATIDAVTR